MLRRHRRPGRTDLVQHRKIRPVRSRCAPAGVADRVHGTFQPARITAQQHHLVPAPGERRRRGQADARTAACHHYRAVHPLIRSSLRHDADQTLGSRRRCGGGSRRRRHAGRPGRCSRAVDAGIRQRGGNGRSAVRRVVPLGVDRPWSGSGPSRPGSHARPLRGSSAPAGGRPGLRLRCHPLQQPMPVAAVRADHRGRRRAHGGQHRRHGAAGRGDAGGQPGRSTTGGATAVGGRHRVDRTAGWRTGVDHALRRARPARRHSRTGAAGGLGQLADRDLAADRRDVSRPGGRWPAGTPRRPRWSVPA